ncbi:MAG: alpha/beta hydrolase [Candidatus Melainabacteria bacterium]
MPLQRALQFFYLRPNQVLPGVPGHFRPVLPVTAQAAVTGGQLVSFRAPDGVQLQGWWCPANLTASEKTIILGHGYYSDITTMIPLSKALEAAGWNVFLFDFRAHGQSQKGVTSMGFHEGKDIAGAVTTVISGFPDQCRKLYYLGHSMGAAALMLCPDSLKKYPRALRLIEDRLDGAILDSAYHELSITGNRFITQVAEYAPAHPVARRMWQPLQPRMATLVQQFAASSQHQAPQTLDLPYPLESLNTARTFRRSRLSRKPVLFIHGLEDDFTPFTHAEANLASLNEDKGSNATLVGLQAGHSHRSAWYPALPNRSLDTILRDDATYLRALLDFLPHS